MIAVAPRAPRAPPARSPRRPRNELPMSLILYQRDDCALCDQALEILAAARAPEFESVFIDDAPALEAAYGARVPVLRDGAGGRELDWPFDVEGVVRFLDGG